MHFKKSVLKNHLLYSIITLMAIAMLFPITAFAQAYVPALPGAVREPSEPELPWFCRYPGQRHRAQGR